MTAVVHKHSDLSNTVDKYYAHSPQENFGRDYFRTGHLYSFSDFQGLAEQMAGHKADNHVIVSHGSEDQLFIPLRGHVEVPGSDFFSDVMSEIASQADDIRKGIKPKENSISTLPAHVITAVAKSCAKIKHKPRIVIRGCQIGKKVDVLSKLGRALGASAIEAPTVDQLFIRYDPHQRTLAEVGAKAVEPYGAPTRRKVFFSFSIEEGYVIPIKNDLTAALERQMHDLGALVVDVYHLAIERKTTPEAWCTNRHKAGVWGDLVNKLWYTSPGGPGATWFTSKVIWEEKKNMWFPFEPMYDTFFSRVKL
jgi:hypothetical protein